MNRKFFLFYFIFILAIAKISFAASPNIKTKILVVEATGKGRTISAAKIDARRNAAQQALGFLLRGSTNLETLYKDGEEFEKKLDEKILRITRAFSQDGEEELSRHEDTKRHIFTVRLRLKISGSELLKGLLIKNPQKSSIDGASLVADAMSRQQWENETSAALIELLYNFPIADYISVETSPAGGFDLKNNELQINVKLKFDRERYFNEAVSSIVPVLDYVAEESFHDLPFLLRVNYLADGSGFINADNNIENLTQYLNLMKVEANGANIYIQTRDYYFNAYKVNQKAFNELVKTLFDSKFNMKGRAELAVKFINEPSPSYLFLDAMKKNMNNIMFFMNDDSLFIFPVFGSYIDKDKDYNFSHEINDGFNVEVSPEELLNISRGENFLQCSVIIMRQKNKK